MIRRIEDSSSSLTIGSVADICEETVLIIKLQGVLRINQGMRHNQKLWIFLAEHKIVKRVNIAGYPDYVSISMELSYTLEVRGGLTYDKGPIIVVRSYWNTEAEEFCHWKNIWTKEWLARNGKDKPRPRETWSKRL